MPLASRQFEISSRCSSFEWYITIPKGNAQKGPTEKPLAARCMPGLSVGNRPHAKGLSLDYGRAVLIEEAPDEAKE